MKNIILLFSLSVLVACGGDKNLTSEAIIATNDLNQIQQQKTKIVNSINTLNSELELLNTAIGKLDPQKNFLLVSTISLQKEVFQHFIGFQGNIDTDQNVVLYPELPGILKSIRVKQGQKVKKGQTLALLSDSGLIEQLEQLEIQRDLAKTTFERQQRLWDQKIGSEIQFLQAKTQYESTEKGIEQLKEQVEKTKILAPFSGIIDHIIADEGSAVSPGMHPIIRLVNLDQMKISAEIPEAHLPAIQPGAVVAVNVPVLGIDYSAEISSVGNFINPNNRSFRVEIELDNKKGNLKPNMTAQIDINDYTQNEAIVVATKNILEDQKGTPYVFRVITDEDGMVKAQKTWIKLGKSIDNRTEILDGLYEGDQIIEEGLRLVEDQQLVKIIQP